MRIVDPHEHRRRPLARDTPAEEESVEDYEWVDPQEPPGRPELINEPVHIDIHPKWGTPPEVDMARFITAQVGDVLVVPRAQELPAGWVAIDDTVRDTDAYPEFALKMGIEEDTFQLPTYRLGDSEDAVAIIKLRSARATH